ncbi:MAG: phosphate acyltransferase PlsX [Chloroflexi bacterium]|nr:MAG: phosphate acyltransferase PlsX [Chloroflexota bacterium]
MIALDAMGGDLGPRETVGGALIAVGEGIEVTLVGDDATLRSELMRRRANPANLHIKHAADTVEMGDKAAKEIRHARQTSMYVGTEMVKSGEASAFVTIGNTGAAMGTGLVVLGRLRGVDRPALSAVLPGEGGPVMLLDVGANADARAGHLVQFAYLGAAYMRAVHGIANPRVAMLSIGEEPTKGSMLVVEAHQTLAAEGTLNFVGNVESREILSGHAEVIVTDGFTGNIVLKLAEGLVQLLFDEMRTAARSSWRSKIGGALLLPALHGVRARLDYRRYGAVPLLGVNGAVFVGHGRSDEAAVASAVRSAQHAVDQGMMTALSAAIAEGQAAAPADAAPEATI